jgi:predicted acetyltransferase
VVTFSLDGIGLERAPAVRRADVAVELTRYLTELDGLDPVPRGSRPRTASNYRHFDYYWSEPQLLPLLVHAGELVVGFALIRALAGDWNIAAFGIRADHRRNGLGRAAVAAVAELARASGADYLTAEVEAWNTGAEMFWTKCGFVSLSEMDGAIALKRALRPVTLVEVRHRKPGVYE